MPMAPIEAEKARGERPIRLLQVSAFYRGHGGGIEAVADELARRLSEQGFAVRWMAGDVASEAPANPVPERLRVDPVRHIDPLERRLGLPMPLWGLRALLRLWQAVGEADVVHVHDYLYQPSLAAIVFARLRRKPLVVTQHIGDIPLASARARALLAWLNRQLGARVLAAASRTAFVGAPVQAYFERFGRFRAGRCPLLIPNGVDPKRFAPSPTRAVLPERAAQLLFVGRFVEKKGLRLLRQCLDVPQANWTFVGDGPLAPCAASTASVRLLGRLPPADIVPLYQQADLLVLPSHGEGFPLVVQEALACGTPVLISREVARAFPATDARCVFDVDLEVADPVAALREALSSLTSDPDRLRQARTAARALALQWSWERCVQSYREVYEAAMREERD
jgi:glycosyltransferase involved in cell wall biosynthesis